MRLSLHATCRVAAALLAAAALCALSGCFQLVVQPYRHKSVYESIYGRKPPYAEELDQMNVTQGK